MGSGIPILQYADDTLVFVNGDLNEARAVRNTMSWFEAFTGLKVKISKIVLYQVNPVLDWDLILALWNCKHGSFPDAYLGLPLGG